MGGLRTEAGVEGTDPMPQPHMSQTHRDGKSESANHYTELRAVYSTLIDRRETLKQHGDDERADELLVAIGDVEELLNDWLDSDDRDGTRETRR